MFQLMYKEIVIMIVEFFVYEFLKKIQYKKFEKIYFYNLKLLLFVKRYQGFLGLVFFYEKIVKFGIEFVKVVIKVEICLN